MKTLRLLIVLLAMLFALPALAHDTWVEPSSNFVRVGDLLHVGLMLGNHGNHHRDFQLAGKVDPQHITLELLAPDGRRTDLKPRLQDLGTQLNPAFWTVRVQPESPGVHRVVCLDDKVVHYAPIRSVKSAKTFFVASESLDEVPAAEAGFNQPLGHPLELVLKTSPASLAPGQPVEVQLLHDGQPLEGTRVSFIPRGLELQGEFDKRYERRTDAQGLARFEPEEGNYYLIVAHHKAPLRSGDGYESTKYSATIVLFTPAVALGGSERGSGPYES